MAPPAESSSLSPKAQAALQACRARTGFQSYHAYLDFHKLDPWALNGLCEPLRPLTESKAESLDTNRELKQSGSLVLNVSKDWQLSVDRLHRDEKGTNIIEAICHRPEDAQLQIILWGNEREKGSSRSRESLVDFLGLRFGLDPLIFWAMDAMCYGDEFQRQEELDRYEPTYVRVGKVIATVCYSRDDSNEKPVLLIAGCPVQLGEELDPCPPFDHSVSLDEQLYSTRTFGRHGFYLRALNQSLERYKTAQAKSIDLLLLGLFPFLQLLLVRIRQECKHMWELLGRSKEAARDNPTRKAAFENTLYIRRSMLRSTIEDAEDGWSSVMRYMRLRCRWNPRRRAIGQALEEDVKSIVAEAKRLESTVRDHLQLQAGVLSLEESKKSIEVSNQQIEEAKRVKIFTILAFVYVPLNLATSIYGMNLQQLNGSGQTLWKFVVTALVALIITGGTWYIAEAANVYRNWHRKRAEQDRLGAEDKGLTYSVVERIAMIMWLLRKHHLAWMWRTGAWSKILFNSTKPMGDDYSGRRYSAGELVSKYSLGQLEDYELKRFIPQKTTRNDPRASKASA